MEASATPCTQATPSGLRPLCGAKTKSGRTCQREGGPNGRCYYHGGTSLAGIASPTYKHGLRSKYMPKETAKLYREAAADPDLLSVRQDAATLVARIHQLLERIPDVPASQLWQELRAAHAKMVLFMRSGETEDFGEAAENLGGLIGRGAHEADLWDEIRAVIQEKAKLAKTEWDRMKALGQMLTAEQAMLFVGAVAAVVRENVSDRAALVRISEGVNRLLARREPTVAETLVGPEELRASDEPGPDAHPGTAEAASGAGG